MLALGLASVVYWKYTDNLAPYAAVQFGGMAGIVILLVATPRGAEALPWWGLIAWYALSKLLETGDTVHLACLERGRRGPPAEAPRRGDGRFCHRARAAPAGAGIDAASNRRQRPDSGRRKSR